MAIVGGHSRVGLCYFAQKICNHRLLKSQNKHGLISRQYSALIAGFYFSDIKDCGLYGPRRAADKVTGGVSQDSYIRTTTQCGTFIGTRENVDEKYDHFRINEELPLSKKSQIQGLVENLPRYWGFDKFQRAFCAFGFSRRLQNPESRRLYRRHGQFVFIRAYTGNESRSEPLYNTKTAYYDILEVHPKATQAQIKTAYYKLSFIYHPDRNAGSEVATDRFSEISEAYTVLGNKALRKKYDRGMLSQSDLVVTARPSAKDTTGSSAARPSDSRRSVMGRQGNVFDFDAFYKAHYGEQLRKEKNARDRREIQKEGINAGAKLNKKIELIIWIMLATVVTIVSSLK